MAKADERTALGTSFIYAIRLTHDPAQEYRYVGKTSRGVTRFYEHKWAYKSTHPHRPLHRWMKKHYGAVTFDVLEYVDDPSMLDLTEIKWIHILISSGYRLLNMTDGGDGLSVGFKHSEESKHKMSESRKGREMSEEIKRKISVSMSGPNHPNYGRKLSDEHVRNISSSHLGNKHTEETKAKISSSQRGSLNHQYGRRGQDSHMFGRIVTEETRKKMSESQKGKPNKGIHTRWHNNRGVVSEECIFCVEEGQ